MKLDDLTLRHSRTGAHLQHAIDSLPPAPSTDTRNQPQKIKRPKHTTAFSLLVSTKARYLPTGHYLSAYHRGDPVKKKQRRVKLAYSADEQKLVVLKIITFSSISEHLVRRYVDNLEKVNKSLDAFIIRGNAGKQDKLYLVMDIVPGKNLEALLFPNKERTSHPGYNNPDFLLKLALRIVDQLIKLYQRGYYYTDIKLLNMMFDENPSASDPLQLIDVDDIVDRRSGLYAGYAMTPGFIPREGRNIVNPEEHMSYALGVLFVMLFTFRDIKFNEAEYVLLKQRLQNPHILYGWQPAFLHDFLSNHHDNGIMQQMKYLSHTCMQRNPRHRPTLFQIQTALTHIQEHPDSPLPLFPRELSELMGTLSDSKHAFIRAVHTLARNDPIRELAMWQYLLSEHYVHKDDIWEVLDEPENPVFDFFRRLIGLGPDLEPGTYTHTGSRLMFLMRQPQYAADILPRLRGEEPHQRQGMQI